MNTETKQFAIYTNKWHGDSLVSEHATEAELDEALEALERRNTCQCFTMGDTAGGCYEVIERDEVEDLDGRKCGYDLDERERVTCGIYTLDSGERS